jgi:hypothetical protein
MKIGRKAMIGFPMRLAVAFLILSVSVPILSEMVDNIENDNSVIAASNEAEKISDAITRTYYAGVGGSCTINVDIGSDCYLSIGGKDSFAYTIGIFLGDVEKERLYLQRPTVQIFGDRLDISGQITLSVECVKVDGEYGVEVNIVD